VDTPTISLTDSSPADIEADRLVLAVIPSGDGVQVAEPNIDDDHADWLHHVISTLGVKAEKDTVRTIPSPTGWKAPSVVLVGIDSETPTAHQIRYAAGAAVREAGKKERIALALPGSGPLHTKAAIEGALLGGYRYSGKKAEPSDSVWSELIVKGGVDDADLDQAVASASAVWQVRDLVNTPPNKLYPSLFADTVTDLFSGSDVAVEVWDEKRLAKEGCGGLLGVGGGSVRPPRMVALRHQPKDPVGHIALVGKGITFDSGGLSLKAPAAMIGMKYDMTGAATVTGVMRALADTGSRIAVTGWLCLAENMPSGTAQRPGDVIEVRGGKTVEVLNTDAEGRLVLADGLQAASEERPDLIVDIATLTGAARQALGERYAALMGTDVAREVLSAAAERTGEMFWPFPLAEELRSGLDSDVADLANISTSNSLGGTMVAGLFLREFVGIPEHPSIAWAHLDVAGPANNSSGAYGFTPKGATGATTRALIDLVTTLDEDAFATLRQ
jgi:leucyl aminopeptidase